jgi:16S rRNA processing protein RimM
MTDREARHLLVGRLRKPHGLKGDCAVFPLTDEPDVVFAPGRTVWVKDLAGATVAGPLTVARSRLHHREWLIGFRGYDRIEAVEGWRGTFLAAEAGQLRALESNEVYLHELAGFAVRDRADAPLGIVSDFAEGPTGVMLTVQGPKREFLLPFRKEFVKEVDRAGRRLVVELPEGLLEL